MISLAGAHGDALELLELAKEILDQVSPLVDFPVECARVETIAFLRDDCLCTASVQFVEKPVRIECLVRKKRFEAVIFDQVRNADNVVALAREQHEVDEVSKRVCQGKDLAGDAATGLAYGLAFSPPFAPCPCR